MDPDVDDDFQGQSIHDLSAPDDDADISQASYFETDIMDLFRARISEPLVPKKEEFLGNLQTAFDLLETLGRTSFSEFCDYFSPSNAAVSPLLRSALLLPRYNRSMKGSPSQPDENTVASDIHKSVKQMLQETLAIDCSSSSGVQETISIKNLFLGIARFYLLSSVIVNPVYDSKLVSNISRFLLDFRASFDLMAGETSNIDPLELSREAFVERCGERSWKRLMAGAPPMSRRDSMNLPNQYDAQGQTPKRASMADATSFKVAAVFANKKDAHGPGFASPASSSPNPNMALPRLQSSPSLHSLQAPQISPIPSTPSSSFAAFPSASLPPAPLPAPPSLASVLSSSSLAAPSSFSSPVPSSSLGSLLSPASRSLSAPSGSLIAPPSFGPPAFTPLTSPSVVGLPAASLPSLAAPTLGGLAPPSAGAPSGLSAPVAGLSAPRPAPFSSPLQSSGLSAPTSSVSPSPFQRSSLSAPVSLVAPSLGPLPSVTPLPAPSPVASSLSPPKVQLAAIVIPSPSPAIVPAPVSSATSPADPISRKIFGVNKASEKQDDEDEEEGSDTSSIDEEEEPEAMPTMPISPTPLLRKKSPPADENSSLSSSADSSDSSSSSAEAPTPLSRKVSFREEGKENNSSVSPLSVSFPPSVSSKQSAPVRSLSIVPPSASIPSPTAAATAAPVVASTLSSAATKPTPEEDNSTISFAQFLGLCALNPMHAASVQQSLYRTNEQFSWTFDFDAGSFVSSLSNYFAPWKLSSSSSSSSSSLQPSELAVKRWILLCASLLCIITLLHNPQSDPNLSRDTHSFHITCGLLPILLYTFHSFIMSTKSAFVLDRVAADERFLQRFVVRKATDSRVLISSRQFFRLIYRAATAPDTALTVPRVLLMLPPFVLMAFHLKQFLQSPASPSFSNLSASSLSSSTDLLSSLQTAMLSDTFRLRRNVLSISLQIVSLIAAVKVGKQLGDFYGRALQSACLISKRMKIFDLLAYAPEVGSHKKESQSWRPSWAFLRLDSDDNVLTWYYLRRSIKTGSAEQQRMLEIALSSALLVVLSCVGAIFMLSTKTAAAATSSATSSAANNLAYTASSPAPASASTTPAWLLRADTVLALYICVTMLFFVLAAMAQVASFVKRQDEHLKTIHRAKTCMLRERQSRVVDAAIRVLEKQGQEESFKLFGMPMQQQVFASLAGVMVAITKVAFVAPPPTAAAAAPPVGTM